MKPLLILVIVLSFLAAVYGYWGAFTVSGNRVYDGMAALLPFYIMLGGLGILLIIGLYYLVLAIIRRRKA